ncbi:T9SS type A sorting domain-containing protein [Bacteroidota bacterium]
MKKVLISIVASLLFSFTGNAQDVVLSPTVIASAGSSSTAGDIHLSWTLGELAVSTLSEGAYILNQGFHQTYKSDIIGIDNEPIKWQINAYPNPVSKELKILFNVPEVTNFLVEIQDVTGKILYQQSYDKVYSEDIITVEMSSFAPGIYFFRISTSDRKQMRILPISKI